MNQNLPIIILDDDLDDAILLKTYIEDLLPNTTVLVFHTVDDALPTLTNKDYQLIFLDINLQHDNGLEIIEKLKITKCVIVSAHPSYAISCFNIDAVIDFIEKPISKIRLSNALMRANAINDAQEYFYLKVGYKLQQFIYADIQYIEANGIYSKIWNKNGSFVLSNHYIGDLEKKLMPFGFLRIHKSFIFNKTYITSFNSRNIWVGETKFPLAVNLRGKLGDILKIQA